MFEAMPSWSDIVGGLISLLLPSTFSAVNSSILLSPLRHIPGPKLAALTSWYEFYFDAIQRGKFVWKIKDLHLRYGLAALPRLKTYSLMCILHRSHRANNTLGGPCERR